jgi:hypothetical protein
MKHHTSNDADNPFDNGLLRDGRWYHCQRVTTPAAMVAIIGAAPITQQ